MTYRTDDTPETDSTSRRAGPMGIGWAWLIVAVLAIVIVLLVAWWLWQGGDGPVRETRSASLGTILEEPETLEEDRVVVSGRVERLLTENALALGNDFVEAELLVLTPPGAFVGPAGAAAEPGVAAPIGGDGAVAPFLEGQFVQITGTVRTFDAEAMTEELGLVLAPELFEPFEGQPAIITELFDVAVRAPQVAAPIEEEVDVGAVLAEPERYAGQAVRVEGGLEEVLSESVFTLGGPDVAEGLLVLGEDTGRFDEVQPGRPIRVEGTVLAFDDEALQQQGVELGDDLDVAALEGRPAIIPTSVEVLEAETVASPTAGGTAEATPQSG